MKLRKMWLEQSCKQDLTEVDPKTSGLEYSIWEIPEKLLRKEEPFTYDVTGTKYIDPVYVLTKGELREFAKIWYDKGWQASRGWIDSSPIPEEFNEEWDKEQL